MQVIMILLIIFHYVRRLNNMNLIEKIRSEIVKAGYDYDKELYFIFMYVSNVYTGVITKDAVVAYTDNETDFPSDDRFFLEGYVFNEDIQLNIDKEDGIFVFKQKEIDALSLDAIEEDMFLLTDDKNYENNSTYVKLQQGKKCVIVPKPFDKEDIANGITLKVVNYIDYDKNDFPYVRYVRLIGFASYKERN